MLVLAFYMLWEQGKKQQEFIEQDRSEDAGFAEKTNDSNITPPSFEPASSLVPNADDLNRTELTALSPTTDSFKNEKLFEGLSNNFSSLVFTNYAG